MDIVGLKMKKEKENQIINQLIESYTASIANELVNVDEILHLLIRFNLSIIGNSVQSYEGKSLTIEQAQNHEMFDYMVRRISLKFLNYKNCNLRGYKMPAQI